MDASTHYDRKAQPGGSQPKRSELQRFHNHAKQRLLETFAHGAHSLLDLACGRGGDIHKWRKLGIQEVTGLDASGASVQEAKRRHAATDSPLNYTFLTCDLHQGWQGGGDGYDVVTCMFALHYFFGTESAAHTIMRTVARNLKPGGVFVGIVADGLRVNECIKRGPFDNGVMRVRALWAGQPQCFGSAYVCDIVGTVTEGSVVPEFLVYGNVLSKVAAMHGLEPIPIELPEFEQASGSGMHRLVPPYADPWRAVSLLYAGFAFRKVVAQ